MVTVPTPVWLVFPAPDGSSPGVGMDVPEGRGWGGMEAWVFSESQLVFLSPPSPLLKRTEGRSEGRAGKVRTSR